MKNPQNILSFYAHLNTAYLHPKGKKATDFLLKKIGRSVLVGIRTPNLLIRSQMLYPIELQKQVLSMFSNHIKWLLFFNMCKGKQIF